MIDLDLSKTQERQFATMKTCVGDLEAAVKEGNQEKVEVAKQRLLAEGKLSKDNMRCMSPIYATPQARTWSLTGLTLPWEAQSLTTPSSSLCPDIGKGSSTRICRCR